MSQPAMKVLRWVGLGLASPFVVAALVAWTVFGRLCTLRLRVLVATASALILAAVLMSPRLGCCGSYSFRTSLLDPVVVLALAAALYSFFLAGCRSDGSSMAPQARRWRRRALLPLAVCVTGFMVAKLVAVSGHAEGWKITWMWLCTIMSVVLYVATARLWADASIPQLELAEAAILRDHAQVDFEQSVVAGLGTLVVRETDNGKGASYGEKPVLVLVHGYAAGNAFWVFVLKRLSAHFRVLCVEIYGCGRSDRRPFHAKTAPETESIVVDALEDWRKAMGITEMVLCGHSLGGMIAAAYAMAHPQRLLKLVLASPAGLGGVPSRGEDGRTSLLYRLYAFLWTRSVGPSVFLRWCGPFGTRLAKTLWRRRMSWMLETARMREVDTDLLAEYLYQLLAQPASGEKILFALLNPMLHAYRPVLETLQGPTQDGEGTDGITCPVSIIYGSPQQDWMPQRHGRALAERLTREGIRAVVRSVQDAGHTLIIENPDGFTNAFLECWTASGVGSKYR